MRFTYILKLLHEDNVHMLMEKHNDVCTLKTLVTLKCTPVCVKKYIRDAQEKASKRFGANKFKVPRNAKYQEDMYEKHFRLMKEKGLLKLAKLDVNSKSFAKLNVDFKSKRYKRDAAKITY